MRGKKEKFVGCLKNNPSSLWNETAEVTREEKGQHGILEDVAQPAEPAEHQECLELALMCVHNLSMSIHCHEKIMRSTKVRDC